jgi:uncharacterized integral membrane protein
MKKVKIFFGLLVLGLTALFAYQNRGFLLQRHEISLNIGFADYHANQPIAIYLLAVFFAGLLLVFFLSLTRQFKSRRTIRNLNGELEAEKERVRELEMKLAQAEAGPEWIGEPVPPLSVRENHS